MWPFRRGGAGEPGPAPDPVFRRESGAWATLPPVAPAVPAHPLTNPPDRFTAGLAAWRNPSFLAPLRHDVDPAAPAGVLHEVIASGAPAGDAPFVDLPVVSRRTGQPLQRSPIAPQWTPAGPAPVSRAAPAEPVSTAGPAGLAEPSLPAARPVGEVAASVAWAAGPPPGEPVAVLPRSVAPVTVAPSPAVPPPAPSLSARPARSLSAPPAFTATPPATTPLAATPPATMPLAATVARTTAAAPVTRTTPVTGTAPIGPQAPAAAPDTGPAPVALGGATAPAAAGAPAVGGGSPAPPPVVSRSVGPPSTVAVAAGRPPGTPTVRVGEPVAGRPAAHLATGKPAAAEPAGTPPPAVRRLPLGAPLSGPAASAHPVVSRAVLGAPLPADPVPVSVTRGPAAPATGPPPVVARTGPGAPLLTADHPAPAAPGWSVSRSSWPDHMATAVGRTGWWHPPGVPPVPATRAESAKPEPRGRVESWNPTVALAPVGFQDSPELPVVRAAVQRDTVAAESPPPAPAPESPPSATPPAAPAAEAPPGPAAAEPDQLLKLLYEPLLRKLKTELRLDRERLGAATDLRR